MTTVHVGLSSWIVQGVNTGGRTVISRTAVPPTFAEVPRTDAWSDDGGRGEFVLECELEPAG